MIKNAQSAIELVILLGFFLFFFTIMFIIIQRNVSDKVYEKQALEIKEIALTIQDEINLASRSSDGYYREFFLATKIGGLTYDANLTDRLVYVQTKNLKHSISLPILEAIGKVKPGLNKIINKNGVVKLNPELVITTSFENNGIIPEKYTCNGADISIPVNFTSIDPNTKSIVIIFENLNEKDLIKTNEYFSHWTVWKITTIDQNVSENSLPAGAIQGDQSFDGGNNYRGPCPPMGVTHKYSLRIYLLDKILENNEETEKSQISKNMSYHIIDMDEVIGYYKGV